MSAAVLSLWGNGPVDKDESRLSVIFHQFWLQRPVPMSLPEARKKQQKRTRKKGTGCASWVWSQSLGFGRT